MSQRVSGVIRESSICVKLVTIRVVVEVPGEGFYKWYELFVLEPLGREMV